MRSAIARTPAGLTVAALALASAVSLAGCEREAPPAAAPPPPPATDQPLAGAPEGPPPPTADAAPPSEQPAPPAGEEPPPPPAMEAPSAAAEPGIVAMAPIPNPPETTRSYPARPAAGTRHGLYARSHVRRVHSRAAVTRRPAAPPTMRSHAAAVRTTAPQPRPAAGRVATPSQATSTRAVQARHGKAAVPTGRHVAAAPNAGAAPQAERLAALQTALGGAMANSAKLDTPHFTVGTPADVSLTIPASFAETLRTEAGRQGLADDAASVALIARLAGDGYVVIPDTVQRQMLAAGQPSVFHWTVTEQQGARGPLQAGVGAQLLGGSGHDQLDLGVIKAAQASGAGWKVAGAILLLLVVAAIVALLARAGGGDRVATERRRRAAGEVRTARPFDMSADPPIQRREDPPR